VVLPGETRRPVFTGRRTLRPVQARRSAGEGMDLDDPLWRGPHGPRRTPSSGCAAALPKVAIFLFAAVLGFAAEFKAGVARIDITPQGPIWLSGYADRKHPSEGVLQPLAAKALAIENSRA